MEVEDVYSKPASLPALDPKFQDLNLETDLCSRNAKTAGGTPEQGEPERVLCGACGYDRLLRTPGDADPCPRGAPNLLEAPRLARGVG